MSRHLNVRMAVVTLLLLIAVAVVAIVGGCGLHRRAVTTYLVKARRAADKDDRNKAQKLYDLHLDHHEGTLDELLEYLRFLKNALNAERVERAVEISTRILAIAPAQLEALETLVQKSMADALAPQRTRDDAARAWGKVRSSAQKLVAVDGARPKAHLYLAQALIGLGEFEEADDELGKALKPRSGISEEQQAEDERARIEAHFLSARFGDKLAKDKPNKKDWQHRKTHIDNAAAVRPKDWAPQLRAYRLFTRIAPLGTDQRSREEREKQKWQYLSRALQLAPETPAVLYAVGIEEERRGDRTAARKYWSKLKEADPSDHRACIALARLAQLDGNVDQAVAMLDEGLQQNERVGALLLFRIALLLVDQGKLDQAEEYLDELTEAVVSRQQPWPVALLKGKLLLRKGKFLAARPPLEEARASLMQVWRREPREADVPRLAAGRYEQYHEARMHLAACLSMLATCYRATGDAGSAFAALGNLLKLTQRSMDARLAYVDALLVAGQIPLAREHATFATRLAKALDQKRQDVWLTLARVEFLLARKQDPGDSSFDAAIRAAEKAVEIECNAEALILKSRILEAAGKHSEAERELTRQPADAERDALRLSQARILLYVPSGRDAKADIAKARALTGRAVADDNQDEAVRLLLSKAREAYDAATRQHGNAIELLLLRPVLLGPGASFDDREEALASALEQAPAEHKLRIRRSLAGFYQIPATMEETPEEAEARLSKASEQLQTIVQADGRDVAARRSLMDVALKLFRSLRARAAEGDLATDTRRQLLQRAEGFKDLARATVADLAKLVGPDVPHVIGWAAECDLLLADGEERPQVAAQVAERLEAVPERDRPWRAWMLLGDVARTNTEAVSCYRRALARNPRSIATGVALVVALNQAKRFAEADLMLARLLEFRPDSPRLKELEKGKFFRERDWARAAELLRDQLKRHRGDPRLLFTLGRVLTASGDREAAATRLREAYGSCQGAVAPGAESPLLLRIVDRLLALHRDIGDTSHREASLALCKDLIESRPKSPHSYFMLAKHHAFWGRLDSAKTALEQALAHAPEGSEVKSLLLFYLGDIARMEGKPQSAAECYRLAVSMKLPPAYSRTARKIRVEKLLGTNRREDADEARKTIRALLVEAPDDPHVHVLAARVAALDWATHGQAKEHCTKALALAKQKRVSMSQPHSVLSRILLAEGDLDKATAASLKAVNAAERPFQQLLWLAELLKRQKRYIEAKPRLDDAEKLNPGSLAVSRARAKLLAAEHGPEDAAAFLKKRIAAGSHSPRDVLALRLDLAWYLEKAGQVDEAREQLLTASKDHEGSLGVLTARVAFLERRGEPADTDALLVNAERTAPNDRKSSIRMLRADTLLARNRSPQDIAQAKSLLAAERAKGAESSTLLRMLGDIARLEGKPNDAIGWYRKALRLNASNIGATFELARLLAEKGDYANALPWARKAVAASDTNSEFQYTLGHILHQLGRFRQAARPFTRCVELEPRRASTLFELGRSLMKQGKHNQAKLALGRALRTALRGDAIAQSERDRIAIFLRGIDVLPR